MGEELIMKDGMITLRGSDGRSVVTFLSKIISIAEGDNDVCTVTLMDESQIRFTGFKMFVKGIEGKLI